MYRSLGKRLVDISVTLPALIILSPVMGVIGILVRLKLGSPVIFSQERPGLHGRPFLLYKFRTMTDDRDEDGNLLPDAERLTEFGKFLRSTSLDELPELWNVFKGDMSLVGPRPLLMEYLDLYSQEQARRHHVKPGLTGWAQVNGRNALTWEERFRLDAWYVDNFNFWLDMKIIFMTIVNIIKREGINHPGHVTMEKFQGTKQIKQ